MANTHPYTMQLPVPMSVTWWIIICRFKITFRVTSVRDGVEPTDSDLGQPGLQETPDISTSIVPSGFDHQVKQPRDEITRKTLSLDDLVSGTKTQKEKESVGSVCIGKLGMKTVGM